MLSVGGTDIRVAVCELGRSSFINSIFLIPRNNPGLLAASVYLRQELKFIK